jgi:hypothetical protein
MAYHNPEIWERHGYTVDSVGNREIFITVDSDSIVKKIHSVI